MLTELDSSFHDLFASGHRRSQKNSEYDFCQIIEIQLSLLTLLRNCAANKYFHISILRKTV